MYITFYTVEKLWSYKANKWLFKAKRDERDYKRAGWKFGVF